MSNKYWCLLHIPVFKSKMEEKLAKQIYNYDIHEPYLQQSSQFYKQLLQQSL